MKPMRALALAALIIAILPGIARADATVFVGADSTPANRPVKGVAFGVGLLVFGFEVEYAVTTEDTSAGAPGLHTGMANLMVQSPIAIFGFQPYFTTGVGIYKEELGAHDGIPGRDDTGFANNIGGGVKLTLLGPLRLRVDYRVLTLGNGALYSPAHRVYTGLNLSF